MAASLGLVLFWGGRRRTKQPQAETVHVNGVTRSSVPPVSHSTQPHPSVCTPSRPSWGQPFHVGQHVRATAGEVVARVGEVRCRRPRPWPEKSERRRRRDREVVAAPERRTGGPGDLFVRGHAPGYGTTLQSERNSRRYLRPCAVRLFLFVFSRVRASGIFWKLAGVELSDGDHCHRGCGGANTNNAIYVWFMFLLFGT